MIEFLHTAGLDWMLLPFPLPGQLLFASTEVGCVQATTHGDNHGVPSGPTVTGKWLAQRGPRFDASSAVYIVSSLAGRRH